MASRESFIQDLNRLVLQALEARERSVAEREASAQEVLAECALERRSIAEQRANIAAAEEMQLAILRQDECEAGGEDLKLELPKVRAGVTIRVPTIAAARGTAAGTSSVVGIASGKRRARIGPQRYTILTALRADPPLTVEALVQATMLSEKRVKDQLRADVPEIVTEEVIPLAHGEEVMGYRLAPAGTDLLARFEQYKRNRNEPLPTPGEAMLSELEGDTEAEADGQENSDDDALDSLLD